MKQPVNRLLLYALVAFVTVAAFQIGSRTRAYYQNVYPSSLSRSEMLGLKLMSAQKPTSAVSDVGEQSGEVDLQPMETFYRVLRALRENYVERIEPTTEREMAHGALRAMLASLDDLDSRFLDSSAYEVIQDQLRGKFHGIGAALAIRRAKEGGREITQLIVVTPMPGSPAEKSGLRAGDVITHVDAKWLVSYDPYAEVNRLAKLARSGQAERSALTRAYEAAQKKLENATTATKAADTLTANLRKDFILTVARSGEKLPLKIRVATGDTVLQPVSHRLLAGNVGYLDIGFFAEETPNEVAAALKDLAAQGATKLVLDLRGCPGGSQESALKAAAEIAPGRIVGVLRKAGNKEEVLKLGRPEDAGAWTRIVVLVDHSTAGMGELVAAGLRDSAGAVLVGENSFGDARQRTVVPQKDDSAVIFTTGEYLSPKRYKYNEHGLTATVKVAPTDSAEDAAVLKALELLSTPEPIREVAHA